MYQVVGFGLSTCYGLRYYETQELVLEDGKWLPTFKVKLHVEKKQSMKGDGTVYYAARPSLLPAKNTYYLNLSKYNKGFTENRNHSSVLAVTQLQDLIVGLLNGKEPDITKPEYDAIGAIGDTNTYKVDYFVSRIACPADISICDSQGRWTGIRDGGIVEEIPNSSYWQIGETKTITFPSGAGAHTLFVKGTGEGTFSLSVESYSNDELIAEARYIDVPVTTSYKGKMVIEQIEDAMKLQSDTDGDGFYETEDSAVYQIQASTTGAYYLYSGYRASIKMDIKQNPSVGDPTGYLQFMTRTASQRVQMKSSTLTSVTANDNYTINVSGTCQVNYQEGYFFKAYITDAGTPGVGQDEFTITISGPDDFSFYSSGTISGGDIINLLQK